MIIQNSNIRRSLVENRYKILGGIVAIILVLYIIRTLNQNLYKKAQENMNNNTQNVTNQVVSTGIIPKEETVISGGDIPKNTQTTNEKVIDEFIQACNAHQLEKAYSLLSKQCQEVLYNSKIELFEKNYIKRIFNTSKTYSIQSWISKKNTTYQVKIIQDMLASGDTNSKTIEEYYTIVREENGYKLNINSYMGREAINQNIQQNGLQISVLYKDMYREYEEYEIEIYNTTQNTILMDTKRTTNSVYLYGENEAKYPANLYEVDETKLEIAPNYKQKLKVSFQKRYSTQTNIFYMKWEDVILNKEEYENSTNKQEYSNQISISIAM
ncbi:MAG: hypothetical protein HFJ27_04340 [Clostridia bacterium]|nr:hypothetical protein [Clostridia bacterium]